MNVFVTCINGMASVDIAQYAQRMVAEIANELGFKDMGIYHYDSTKESPECLSTRYDGIIAGIVPEDIVILQHPTWNDLGFEKGFIERVKAYHARTAIFIHDIIALMFEVSRFQLAQVVELYNQVEALIVPSYAMRQFLLDHGVRENMKFVIQEIWDYKTDISFSDLPIMKKEIHFAGNPDRFMFLNQWNYDIPLKVYTSQPCAGQNVKKMEHMNPSKLLLELATGGMGLVWYGSEYWHQYMMLNNSLKLSTYLAAGIPVIVPKGISNEYLIEKNNLGMVVESLEEAIEKMHKMTESEYQNYINCVGRFAFLIREGYFIKKLLINTVHTILRDD